MNKILHLDSSVRGDDSLTRRYSQKIATALASQNNAEVTHRNLNANTQLLTGAMVESYFTDPTNRSQQQQVVIQQSNAVLNDLREHDTYVIGVPMYNFAMPAAFKAWADLAARVGETFKYTDNGPVGLLKGKRAFIVVSSGGTTIGSDIDFLTPWLKQFFGFLGVQNTCVVEANENQLNELLGSLSRQHAA